MTNTMKPETFTIQCAQCQFRWTSPNTPKGKLYLANTGAGHTALYPGHAVELVTDHG